MFTVNWDQAGHEALTQQSKAKMLTQVTLPLHNQFTMVWRSPPNDAYANSDKLSSMVSRFVLISHNYNIHEAVAVPAVSRRSLIHGS